MTNRRWTHLKTCFEKRELTPFPVFRVYVDNSKVPIKDTTAEWKFPRRSARIAKKEELEDIPTSKNIFEVLSTEKDADTGSKYKTSTLNPGNTKLSLESDSKFLIIPRPILPVLTYKVSLSL